jgi:hypothetical protein
VFAKNEAGVSEREIGLIFFLNTVIAWSHNCRSQSSSRAAAACAR